MSISAIVIDDDKDVKDVFVELLQVNDMNVVGTGHDDKQAFELYQKHKPDIVFMDDILLGIFALYGHPAILISRLMIGTQTFNLIRGVMRQK